jgi:hypothetical protein
MLKQEIVSILTKNVCKVTFEKADGSLRDMICTLNFDLIPIQIAGTSKPNDEVVTVWDMEKEDWRAFRVDRLVSTPEPIAYIAQ